MLLLKISRFCNSEKCDAAKGFQNVLAIISLRVQLKIMTTTVETEIGTFS